MGKRFIISESEKNDIRKMYGLYTEQKYMSNYSGKLLDFCGYRAIEKFEETLGTTKGTSMGDDYFESKIMDYESLINNNLNNTIGVDVFMKLPPKLRMQVWSWMFNSTDASDGTVKWLAGLGQAMGLNQNSNAKTEQEYRQKVMSKTSQEFDDVINSIKNFRGSWDNVYSNYLDVLDKQYQSTALNNKLEGSYKNSWRYRPTKMDEYYDNCGVDRQTNNVQQTPPPQQQTQTTLSKKTNTQDNTAEYDEFAKRIKTETENASIDLDSIDFEITDRTFTFSPGNRKIKKIILVIGRESEGLNMNQNFEQKIKNIRNKNPEYTFTPRNEPGTCRNCLVIKGKPTPIVYQLFIMEEKNNEIESQYGQEQQTNSDDLTDF
jgi:hypothetical protein